MDRLTTVSFHQMCATEPIVDMVSCRQLQWLGHLARMEDSCLPKSILFAWFPATRPAHGPRRCWRDVVRDDLKAFTCVLAGMTLLDVAMIGFKLFQRQ